MNYFLKDISNSDNVACTAVTDMGGIEGWNQLISCNQDKFKRGKVSSTCHLEIPLKGTLEHMIFQKETIFQNKKKNHSSNQASCLPSLLMK